MNKEWISVEEDLPNGGEVVIFCNKDFSWAGWHDAYEEGEELSWYSCDDNEYVDEVTHWMYLPHPFCED